MDFRTEKSRRKSFVLQVRAGEIVVRAPLSASDAEIEAFVARHRRWIAARRREAERPVPTFEDGAELTLFGKRYTLATGRTHEEGTTLFLPAENREAALVAYLKKTAAAHMGELTRRIAQQYGFSYASVRITSARTRWGSCSKRGNISYTFRNAFLPDPAVAYIVVHELCHTRFFDHSAKFWREVAKILPDYAERRKLVRSCGLAMKVL